MSKTYIRTSDVFEHEDASIRLTDYVNCFKIASWLGIVSGKEKTDDHIITLYLTGSSIKICLYYMLTIPPNDGNILDVFKRVLYIMK